MKFLNLVLLIAFGLLVPIQAYASHSSIGTGTNKPNTARDRFAGLGAAELIRRRRASKSTAHIYSNNVYTRGDIFMSFSSTPLSLWSLSHRSPLSASSLCHDY